MSFRYCWIQQLKRCPEDLPLSISWLYFPKYQVCFQAGSSIRWQTNSSKFSFSQLSKPGGNTYLACIPIAPTTAVDRTFIGQLHFQLTKDCKETRCSTQRVLSHVPTWRWRVHLTSVLSQGAGLEAWGE